jgi:GNAT superfamily N-acetyltransferase
MECGNKIIGLICNIYEDIKLKDAAIKARCGFNFGVHPRYRGWGVGLFKRYLQFYPQPLFAFSAGKVSLMEEKILRHKAIVGIVHSRLLILNMKKIIQAKTKSKLLAVLAGIIWKQLLRLLLARRPDHVGLAVKEMDSFDQRADNFWQEVSPGYGNLVIRNKEYLNWRFVRAPFRYKIFGAQDQGLFAGYIVLRVTPKKGFLSGVIVDLFTRAEDGRTMVALICRAVDYFVGQGVDFIEYRGLLKRGLLLDILKKKGFFFRIYLRDFLVHALDAKTLSKMLDDKAWFITGSEIDVDFA